MEANGTKGVWMMCICYKPLLQRHGDEYQDERGLMNLTNASQIAIVAEVGGLRVWRHGCSARVAPMRGSSGSKTHWALVSSCHRRLPSASDLHLQKLDEMGLLSTSRRKSRLHTSLRPVSYPIFRRCLR